MSIGVLFDLDGTLLDTLEDLKNATNATLRSFGCPERSLEEVRQFVGNGAGVLMKKPCPERPRTRTGRRLWMPFIPITMPTAGKRPVLIPACRRCWWNCKSAIPWPSCPTSRTAP